MMVWLYDFFLRPEHPRMPLAHRAANFFFRGIQQLLIKLGVRFVWRDTIRQQSMWVNFHWDYSVLRRIYPEYQENLARIAQRCCAKYPRGSIIDIGAAMGDTILQIRSRVEVPILAVDPHPALLQKNFGWCEDVQIVPAYVRGKNLAGELTPEVSGAAVPTLRLREILEKCPDLPRARLLKIDTDGHDFGILRDNEEWLRKAQPVLYLEYDPMWNIDSGDTGLATLAYLHRLGYERALVYSSTGIFMVSVDMGDERTWRELHAFIVKKCPIYYYDICLFTAADRDLFEEIRELELAG